MTTVSAHGREVGRIYYTTFAKAYMEDGVILITNAGKWTVYGRCRSGFTPEQAYAIARRTQDDLYMRNPALKVYRDRLRSVAGIGKAWKLHSAIQHLGEDIDGIWSECCNGYGGTIHATPEEIGELVRYYNMALEIADGE